jgi:hypothetical protein
MKFTDQPSLLSNCKAVKQFQNKQRMVCKGLSQKLSRTLCPPHADAKRVRVQEEVSCLKCSLCACMQYITFPCLTCCEGTSSPTPNLNSLYSLQLTLIIHDIVPCPAIHPSDYITPGRGTHLSDVLYDGKLLPNKYHWVHNIFHARSPLHLHLLCIFCGHLLTPARNRALRNGCTNLCWCVIGVIACVLASFIRISKISIYTCVLVQAGVFAVFCFC